MRLGHRPAWHASTAVLHASKACQPMQQACAAQAQALSEEQTPVLACFGDMLLVLETSVQIHIALA